MRKGEKKNDPYFKMLTTLAPCHLFADHYYNAADSGFLATLNSSSFSLRSLGSLASSQISATSSTLLLDLRTTASIILYIARGRHETTPQAPTLTAIATGGLGMRLQAATSEVSRKRFL